MIKRVARRVALGAAAVVAAALAAVVVSAPAAQAEPACRADMNVAAFTGTYKLTVMTSGGQFVYASNLVLGAPPSLAATEFGSRYNPITGQWEPATAYGEWRSQYIAGDTCTAFFYTRPQNGAYVNCYGGSAPVTNGVRVTRFDGACRLSTPTGVVTRTFIADRI